jgi:RimJ/RimL family protein N-acetyltransferase
MKFVYISNHSLKPGTKIVAANEQLVETFIKNLKKGASHFRYYDKRPVSCIHKHLLTIMITDEFEMPMAYGHLEKEDDILWLGIAVGDDYLNKGFGKIIMKQLIDFAINKKESMISLSVDDDNHIAQKLYISFGFIKTSEFPGRYVFELKLI